VLESTYGKAIELVGKELVHRQQVVKRISCSGREAACLARMGATESAVTRC